MKQNLYRSKRYCSSFQMALNVKLTIEKVKIREQCLIEQMKNYIIKFLEKAE